MSMFFTSGIADSASMSAALSTRYAYSSIPSANPTDLPLPLSMATRDGDLSLNAVRIVDATLLAMRLAVAYALPEPAFNPFLRPAIACIPALLNCALKVRTDDIIRLLERFTSDTALFIPDLTSRDTELNPDLYVLIIRLIDFADVLDIRFVLLSNSLLIDCSPD